MALAVPFGEAVWTKAAEVGSQKTPQQIPVSLHPSWICTLNHDSLSARSTWTGILINGVSCLRVKSCLEEVSASVECDPTQLEERSSQQHRRCAGHVTSDGSDGNCRKARQTKSCGQPGRVRRRPHCDAAGRLDILGPHRWCVRKYRAHWNKRATGKQSASPSGICTPAFALWIEAKCTH